MNKALIIVPTYNERENIRKLVGEVLEKDSRLEMLIVDDNSPDGTGELADQLAEQDSRVHAIHRQSKLGLGSAYREGFRWASSETMIWFSKWTQIFPTTPAT